MRIWKAASWAWEPGCEVWVVPPPTWPTWERPSCMVGAEYKLWVHAFTQNLQGTGPQPKG